MTQTKHKKIQTLLQRREDLFRKLEGLSDMVDGSVVQIFRKCGKPSCKCAQGEKHGAWALLYKDKNKRTQMVYIPAGGLTEARRRRKRYDQFKQITKKILDLNRQILKLDLAERKTGGRA